MNSFSVRVKRSNVLTFEAILFTFSSSNLGEKTRNFFPVEPFFYMSYMKLLWNRGTYSKEPVVPSAPMNLILTFAPISGFLEIYPFMEN